MEKQGIVVFQAKDIAKVRLTTGEECLATVTGKFRQQALAPKDYPIVGDFVQGRSVRALCHDRLGQRG